MLGHFTYLVLELVWAIPILTLQWAVGWKTLLKRRRTLLLALIIPTAYLSCSDGVAIAQSIWTLHPGRIVGLRLGDVPVEEVVFFLLTNAMVVNSVILLAGRRGSPVTGIIPSRGTCDAATEKRIKG
jgi:putative membrane protein